MDNLDDIMDMEEEQYTTASLSSPSFLIDVLISNKGEVHAVKLTLVGEDSNTSYDQDLTDTLKYLYTLAVIILTKPKNKCRSF
jgi:hypothetical protein